MAAVKAVGTGLMCRDRASRLAVRVVYQEQVLGYRRALMLARAGHRSYRGS